MLNLLKVKHTLDDVSSRTVYDIPQLVLRNPYTKTEPYGI